VNNDFAPEHLCLLIENPEKWIDCVENAGGIFVGEGSFEVLGDYVAGPSHVMPTSGTARFASPLNVWDFVKITSLIGFDDATASDLSPAAAKLAHAEGLTAHAAAAEARIKE
jgi:histidinol dehydrogenase